MSRLRQIREDRGISQQQLADKVVPSTSQPQIDRLEKGQRKITKEWAVRLARALECHWVELMGDDVPVLSDEERNVVELFRGLSDSDKRAVFRHIDALNKSPGRERGN
jgi:transcriptional regulator with XRE-family HTH domain